MTSLHLIHRCCHVVPASQPCPSPASQCSKITLATFALHFGVIKYIMKYSFSFQSFVYVKTSVSQNWLRWNSEIRLSLSPRHSSISVTSQWTLKTYPGTALGCSVASSLVLIPTLRRCFSEEAEGEVLLRGRISGIFWIWYEYDEIDWLQQQNVWKKSHCSGLDFLSVQTHERRCSRCCPQQRSCASFALVVRWRSNLKNVFCPTSRKGKKNIKKYQQFNVLRSSRVFCVSNSDHPRFLENPGFVRVFQRVSVNSCARGHTFTALIQLFLLLPVSLFCLI